MAIEFINNPVEAIGAINMALSKERASDVSVQTVRMAKGILSGKVKATEQMRTAAQQLKDKLYGTSSAGRNLWNNA